MLIPRRHDVPGQTMVQLFSLCDAHQRCVTVWANGQDEAACIAARQAGLARETIRIVDITNDQTDLENPYRAYALSVIAEGTKGIAHLRIGHDEASSGWVFRDLVPL